MKHKRSIYSGLILGLSFIHVGTPVFAASHPDSGVSATYNVQVLSNEQFAYWSVCGQLPLAGGCFGSGTLGPFGVVGALLESGPATNGNVVTRHIYVLDTASGIGMNGVTLYIYKRVDSITQSFDTVTVTLQKQVALPLTGGISARASMAAGPTYVYMGTNLDGRVVQIKKSTNAMTLLSGPGGNVTAVTANSYGYVTVTAGSNSGSSAFTVYQPDGSAPEVGGGAEFMLNSMNAVVPADLPLFP